MHRIAGIVSGALMRYGRMVVSVRQGADVPYQRERQQEQNPMETTGVPGRGRMAARVPPPRRLREAEVRLECPVNSRRSPVLRTCCGSCASR